MVFTATISFKQGIKAPNIIKSMNFANPTATDRLMMSRVRIWGPTIETHLSTGLKKFVKHPNWMRDRKLAEVPTHSPLINHPYFDMTEIHKAKRESQETKKFRYMMKGVKVGRKKGGGKVELMSVFEKKK